MRKTVSYLPFEETVKIFKAFTYTFPELTIVEEKSELFFLHNHHTLSTIQLNKVYDDTDVSDLFTKILDYCNELQSDALKPTNIVDKDKPPNDILTLIDSNNLTTKQVHLFKLALDHGLKQFEQLQRTHSMFKMYAVFISTDEKLIEVAESSSKNSNGQSTNSLHAEQSLTNQLQNIPPYTLKWDRKRNKISGSICIFRLDRKSAKHNPTLHKQSRPCDDCQKVLNGFTQCDKSRFHINDIIYIENNTLIVDSIV